MIIMNRGTPLIGIPKRVSMQRFGRLRVGRRKTAIKDGGKRGIVSRLISRVKEGQDCMVQTRAERHLESGTPPGGVRPSLDLQQTCASRFVDSS